MKKIDIKTTGRAHIYEWFSGFSNTTYSINKKLDVTKLVNASKNKHESFFIYFMYNVIKAINSVPEMRIRLEDSGVVIYDHYELSCAFTVLL